MTAQSRWWTSPDGRRTMDLAAVIETYDEPAQLYVCTSATIPSLRMATMGARAEADSFLSALTAWREAQDKPENWACRDVANCQQP